MQAKAGCNPGKGFEGWQTAGLNALTTEGYVQAKAGCNPGTAKADGQRAWWKLPQRNWKVLRV